jgi:hypothetical protein
LHNAANVITQFLQFPLQNKGSANSAKARFGKLTRFSAPIPKNLHQAF